ncbi:hypothetical protein BAE44_0024446 [Dichanthelium oligosanthes]|uniref:Uncharacterized protein n=1 Tax=Dichanthelium oligosanthes TaxID=888268 RepID=A0A1E5UNW4_9POAL|nr:hypothetical protein BAE44_0024446 [Dichanthelium oligosanthes]
MPPLPAVDGTMWECRMFLVFNPTVSRHYEVLVSPLDPKKQRQRQRRPAQDAQPAMDKEWPPSRWEWHVFSSRSGRWREKVFVREGEAVGIVADMLMDSVSYVSEAPWRHAFLL